MKMQNISRLHVNHYPRNIRNFPKTLFQDEKKYIYERGIKTKLKVLVQIFPLLHILSTLSWVIQIAIYSPTDSLTFSWVHLFLVSSSWKEKVKNSNNNNNKGIYSTAKDFHLNLKSYDSDKNESKYKVERGLSCIRDLVIKCFERSERGENKTWRRRQGLIYNLTSKEKEFKKQRWLYPQWQEHHEKGIQGKKSGQVSFFGEHKSSRGIVKNMNRWRLALILHSPDKHYKELNFNSLINKESLAFFEQGNGDFLNKKSFFA